jgi:hypothetical protein
MTALFESQEELRIILRVHKADRLSLRKDLNSKQARAYKAVREHLANKEAQRLADDVGYWD